MKPQKNPVAQATTDFPDIFARLLAEGVIRLLQRKKGLAERTEQSVSTGVLTTQEDLHDAQ
jgi:hypothetical protein